jgi:AcrR family transcriptional regulator
MAPPRNTRRRNALADAAIEVLGSAGMHKLSHRAVDERAGLPAGTAANYFPRRDDLLAAAAERVAELHVAEMTAADRTATGPAGPDALAELIGASLHDAHLGHRPAGDRYPGGDPRPSPLPRHRGASLASSSLTG